MVAPTRQKVQKQLVDIRLVAATLDPKTGSLARRRRRFARLQEKYSRSKEPSQKQLSKQMASWVVGLFVLVVGKVPCDNLDLERFFRIPKGHERRIHGHKHVGMRVVREGATLLPTLDVHHQRVDLFTAEQLLPYRNHPIPGDQIEAQHRHQVMRRAASTKQRPGLLQELNKSVSDERKHTDLDSR